MPARGRPPRRRGLAARNPSVLVMRMMWSMAKDRPVRITLRDGAGTVTGLVVRLWVDESLGSPEPKSQASTVGFVLASGREIAVNSIERVQLPLDRTEAAFGDD